MGGEHAGAALSVIALVASVALVAWLQGKEICTCTKVLAWIALLASVVLLAAQVVSCYKCCSIGGGCERGSPFMTRGMGPYHGGMIPMPMDKETKAPETGSEKKK